MTFKIGWIGCGRQASEMLLPRLVMLDDVVLDALVDIDERALARTARRFGGARRYQDYRDLLADGGVDGIGMAVGPAMHREIALAALRRGLPTFMEKPPAADLAGALEVLAAAEKAKKPVLVGFMKRFSTGNRIAGNLLEAEDFGQRLSFLGSYMTAPTYFAKEDGYRGFLLHHCVHYLDLMPWLMASPIADLAVRKLELIPGKLLVHLNVAFESGAIGMLAMGTMQSRGAPVELIQIMGDHRKIEISNVTDVRYVRDPAFKANDLGAALIDGIDTLCWTPNMTVAAEEDHKGYRQLLQTSLDAMRGEVSIAPTIEDGVRAMASLEKVAQALDLRL